MDVVAGPSRSSEHKSEFEKPSCGPSSFAETKKLKMDALQGLCKNCILPFSGRVTKKDLLELAAILFGFSTSGRHKSGEGSSEKSIIPMEVRQAFKICRHLPALLLAGQFLICAKSLITPWRMCPNIC